MFNSEGIYYMYNIYTLDGNGKSQKHLDRVRTLLWLDTV